MDAFGAVEAAKNWISWGPEKAISAKSGNIDLPILPDEETKSSLTLEADDNSTVAEAVVVTLNLHHQATDHLDILLKSPKGTVSKLTAFKPQERAKENQNSMLTSSALSKTTPL